MCYVNDNYPIGSLVRVNINNSVCDNCNTAITIPNVSCIYEGHHPYNGEIRDKFKIVDELMCPNCKTHKLEYFFAFCKDNSIELPALFIEIPQLQER